MGSPVVARGQVAATGNRMFCSPHVGGQMDTQLIKLESPSPQNLWEQNLKDKIKPTKTHTTNQHSNLRSRRWIGLCHCHLSVKTED